MPDESGTRLLRGKIAVVTGGGRGIGRAIALAYERDGADLCLVARTRAQLESVADEIRSLERRALVVEADVTEQDQVERTATEIGEAFGRVNVLVNNAGGGRGRSSVLESDPGLWIQDVMDNLVSAYLVTRALLPLMIEFGGGHIINVGSGTGHRPAAGGSA